MHAKIISATTLGVDAYLVDVEVDLAQGLPNFYIVGLPDTAIRESSKRIIAALKNCGIHLPAKKVTVNLAPADLKKEGTLFDLPIALGIIKALNLVHISEEFINETIFLGELSLDGSIKFIKGALPIAYDVKKLNKKRLILPKSNAQEAALIEEIEIIGVSHITELIAYIRGECVISPTKNNISHQHRRIIDFDYAQVKGQFQAKRALQIAAAGRHNILFIGPPGSGKTMLAKRLPSIMPEMNYEEILATTKIYSICGKLQKSPLITKRPFRNPHHTISQAGLIGGGSYPQPGEISLASNGILFLDELTEFKRDTLEALRQPLESKRVDISRVQQSLSYPADFLLIVALNPCPCGFLGDKKRACYCSSLQITRYLNKLSGPLLDRIDLQINVQSIEYNTIKDKDLVSTSSDEMYNNVQNALTVQKERFNSENQFNNSMTPDHIEKFCVLTCAAEEIIKKAFDKLHLSMRGYHKILKVARTIADLEKNSLIDVQHIQEAIMYRSLDQYLEKQRA